MRQSLLNLLAIAGCTLVAPMTNAGPDDIYGLRIVNINDKHAVTFTAKNFSTTVDTQKTKILTIRDLAVDQSIYVTLELEGSSAILGKKESVTVRNVEDCHITVSGYGIGARKISVTYTSECEAR